MGLPGPGSFSGVVGQERGTGHAVGERVRRAVGRGRGGRVHDVAVGGEQQQGRGCLRYTLPQECGHPVGQRGSSCIITFMVPSESAASNGKHAISAIIDETEHQRFAKRRGPRIDQDDAPAAVALPVGEERVRVVLTHAMVGLGGIEMLASSRDASIRARIEATPLQRTLRAALVSPLSSCPRATPMSSAAGFSGRSVVRPRMRTKLVLSSDGLLDPDLQLVPCDLAPLDHFDEAVVVAGAGDDCAARFLCETLHQCRVPSRPVGVVGVAGERRFDREVGRLSLCVYGLGDDDAGNEALDLIGLQVSSVLSGDAPAFDSRNDPLVLEIQFVGDERDVGAGLRFGYQNPQVYRGHLFVILRAVRAVGNPCWSGLSAPFLVSVLRRACAVGRSLSGPAQDSPAPAGRISYLRPIRPGFVCFRAVPQPAAACVSARIRLFFRPVFMWKHTKAGWFIVSDNPDRNRFPTQPWGDDAKIMGEVKWHGQSIGGKRRDRARGAAGL